MVTGSDWQTVRKAQERYCVDGLSCTQVAGALGIDASTVRRWAKRHAWDDERAAMAEAEAEIRANTLKARVFALRRLLEAQSGGEASQAAFAVVALERLALARRALERPTLKAAQEASSAASRGEPKVMRGQKEQATRSKATKKCVPLKKIEASGPDAIEESGPANPALPSGEGLNSEERIHLLEEAVNRQLAHVLTHPADDLAKRIKEIKAAFDVLASIRGKSSANTGIVVSFEEKHE